MQKHLSRIGTYAFWTLIVLFTAVVLIMNVLKYASFQPEVLEESSVFSGRFTDGAFWLYLHIFTAAIALILGPFQFITALRNRFPVIHRWMGRTYLGIGILLGGISGLVIAQGTKAGLTGVFGFSLLALGWLFTGLQAFIAIRGGRTQDHKRWMIRNYALTCAALTLRLYIGIGMVSLMPFVDARYGGSEDALFMDIYQLVSWLSWVPNLLLAEVIINRQRKLRRADVVALRPVREAAFANPE